jgi:IS30 family transposase
LRTPVFALLAQRWSHEQIARGLPQRYPHEPTMQISHEAIYTYLYVLPRGAFKRELVRYLRRRHRFRRLRKVRLSSRPILDLISSDERPVEVTDRTVPGYWERDLLVGHANASALGTLVEQTTRFTLLVPLKAKGVTFEHYDLPDTRREGDVHISGHMKIAWFKDPDGNILNIVSG